VRDFYLDDAVLLPVACEKLTGVLVEKNKLIGVLVEKEPLIGIIRKC